MPLLQKILKLLLNNMKKEELSETSGNSNSTGPDVIDENLFELSPSGEENEFSLRLQGIFSLPPQKRLLHGPFQIFLMMLVVSILYWSYPQGQFLWASGDAVFNKNEFWRLFTALFTHADIAHLLANGWIFVLFGWMLRTYFSFWAFPVLSFIAGIISNAATIYFYPPEVRLIGASGMVHSMVAIWIVWYILFDRAKSPGQRLLRAAGFSLAMLVPAVVKPDVSYLAHGTGFLTGGFLSLLFVVPVKRRVKILEESLQREQNEGIS